VAEGKVDGRHALWNALLPVVTLIGLQLGLLLSGAVLTETIFALPGLGRLTITSVLARDYPVVQGVVLIGAAIFVLTNLLVDLLYAWLDPRIRYS
jgi:ABC-type dipeptide/oligopeptide/nickel transport system permease component